jgi:hypothetical protein
MTFADYINWWEMLEAAGLRPFWTEVWPVPFLPLVTC